MQIRKATRKNLKGKIGLMGTAGTGKSWTALSIAENLGQNVLGIDSERGRLEAYAGDFEFDYIRLAKATPEEYIDAFSVGVEEGYDVFVVDSISHEWAGKEGILSAVDRFGGWKVATPRHDEFVNVLFSLPVHVVATIRAKTRYDVQEVERSDGKGKTQEITSLGVGPVQRDNLEYEFDLLGMLDRDHSLTIWKSMLADIRSGMKIEAGDEPRFLGRFIADSFLTWVNEGESVPRAKDADEAKIARLVALLESEGFSLDTINDRFRKRRLELGALTDEYVTEQIELSEQRLAAKGRPAAPEKDAAATPEAEPTPEPPAEPEPEKPSQEPQGGEMEKPKFEIPAGVTVEPHDKED